MKTIYVIKETGKEVHYGEDVTFEEHGTYGNNYKWESTTTFPLVNETIPMLIKKGIIVQKEVKEEKEKCNDKISNKELLTYLDNLALMAESLSEQVSYLTKLLLKK